MIDEQRIANLVRLVVSFIMEREGAYALSVRADFEDAMNGCDNLAGKLNVAMTWLKAYNRLPRRSKAA